MSRAKSKGDSIITQPKRNRRTILTATLAKPGTIDEKRSEQEKNPSTTVGKAIHKSQTTNSTTASSPTRGPLP